MLANACIHPTVPVVDLDRARKFYEDTLGLKPSRVDGPPAPGVMYEAGEGTSLYIFQSGATATKDGNTLAAFEVDDVEREVKELKAKGVTFEEYDLPGLKTVNSIASVGDVKGAWFKDTEGNILGVIQLMK